MNVNLLTLFIFVLSIGSVCRAQDYQVKSPDQKIAVSVKNGDELRYSITFNGKSVIMESELGFEFKAEAPMKKGFAVTGQKEQTIKET
jgi:alpha-glucosidase